MDKIEKNLTEQGMQLSHENILKFYLQFLEDNEEDQKKKGKDGSRSKSRSESESDSVEKRHKRKNETSIDKAPVHPRSLGLKDDFEEEG